MSVYAEIGESIVNLRKRKGFTQEKLALECEISTSYLRRIEHGAANPTIKELKRITDAWKWSLRIYLLLRRLELCYSYECE